MEQTVARPEAGEFAPFYANYINLVPARPLLPQFQLNIDKSLELLGHLPLEAGDFAYAEGKWSIKELVQHCIDTEQIMLYRALRFVRNDGQALAGFDEDAYVAALSLEQRKLSELLTDWQSLRQFSQRFFLHLRAEDWLKRGVASGKTCSVRALAYIILGHESHHRNILEERYLPYV